MTDIPEHQTDADAVIDAARSAGIPRGLDPNTPEALIVPAGATLEVPPLREWRERPVRRVGVYRPATVEAFTAYVGWLAYPEQTTVWVHPTSGAVWGVLDDNGTEPGWGDHRAELQLTVTPEWAYWSKRDGEMLGQEAFAEHIEGGLEEIVEPDSATMLEVAQTFHAASSAQFRSSTRLASGEQRFQYDEEIKASAGATGDITVPTMVLLAIAPFIGEDRYKIAARFRFRLSAGKLTLGYVLDRPDSVKRDALEGIASRLAEKFPRTFVGQPSSLTEGA